MQFVGLINNSQPGAHRVRYTVLDLQGCIPWAPESPKWVHGSPMDPFEVLTDIIVIIGSSTGLAATRKLSGACLFLLHEGISNSTMVSASFSDDLIKGEKVSRLASLLGLLFQVILFSCQLSLATK